ncbi:MAG: glycerophosphodiester phosphodiesterase [Granulosicoccaceae bacterium]
MASHPYLDHPGILAFAHRGDSQAAPENTLAAFRSAHDLGFRYFETDVHLSKDGVLLAFHDHKLDRVTDSCGLISKLDHGQIKQAKVGGTDPIPTLSELLEEFPHTRINIEPKSDDAVRPLIDLIKATKSIDRVCMGSFNGRRIQQIRQALPNACTSMGPRETLWARLGSLGLPAPELTAHCAQVPTHFLGVPVADTRFIQHLHELGMQTHIWTVNEESEMHRLLDAGATGLMTDRPAMLRSVLEARGQWSA